MPARTARNEERAAEHAHRVAALRRRALAEAKDVLALADEAAGGARRTVAPDGGPPEGTGRTSPG